MKASTATLAAIGVWLSAFGVQAAPAAPAADYDTQRSYFFLSQLQKRLCQTHKSPICEFSQQDCVERLTAGLGDHGKGEANAPSPAVLCATRPGLGYETPGVYMMLQDYYHDILAVLPELGFTTPVEPALGSLPLEDVNASVTSNEDAKARIIVLNQGLFILAISLPKIAAYSVPRLEAGDQLSIDTSIEGTARHLQSAQLMPQFVGALLTGLGLMYEPQADAQGIDQPMIMAYIRSIETFAIAHEVAHILLGHTSPVSSLAMDKGCQAPLSSATAFRNSWIQEVEADLLAQRIMNAVAVKKIADQDGNPIMKHTTPLGPGYYFFLMEIRNDTRTLLQTGKYPAKASKAEEAALKTILACLDTPQCNPRKALERANSAMLRKESHPTPVIRRQIVEHLAAKTPTTGSREEEQALLLSRTTYRNTGIMWALSREKLPELYKSGVRMKKCDTSPGVKP